MASLGNLTVAIQIVPGMPDNIAWIPDGKGGGTLLTWEKPAGADNERTRSIYVSPERARRILLHQEKIGVATPTASWCDQAIREGR